MGDFISKIFIEPSIPTDGCHGIPDTGYGFVQVLFLGLCYGYLLLLGSNLISDGSELLLLIPEAAGVVGSVVLPVLGAVPDGAIVLFSGLGPKKEAASQLAVGVGALAGSTVMLLTVPWFLSVLGGRVQIVDGEPCYSRRLRHSLGGSEEEARQPGGCFHTGVGPDKTIRVSAQVMVVTCLIGYAIVEVPAFILRDDSPEVEEEDIKPAAYIGAAACAIMFAAYLWLQFRLARMDGSSNAAVTDARAIALAQRLINRKELSLAGVLSFLAPEEAAHPALDDSREVPLAAAAASTAGGGARCSRTALEKRLRAVVRPFFNRYDLDQSGTLSKEELAEMVSELGERVRPGELDELFKAVDTDCSGMIDYEECVQWLAKVVTSSSHNGPSLRRAFSSPRLRSAEMQEGASRDGASWPSGSLSTATTRVVRRSSTGRTRWSSEPGNRPSWADRATRPLSEGAAVDSIASHPLENEAENDDDDEEPEMPEDIRDLPPHQQRRRVLQRACWQMGLGTFIVLLFSDPMVDVLDTLGARTGIPAFYVAFLLAPMASNASEMIASFNYAQKKSQKSISIAFSQLLGAACMNNTFCLGIFYLLIALRGLNWTYHAEVIGTVAAELAVAAIAYRQVHSLFHGFLVLMLMPLCLLFVYILKATAFAGQEK
eukprot:CAMPEP_0206444582 /NCGR_PEP_ID=MMETSP0324_2-20121206/14995_1 /ASSEMBLY_ACC=CAM_ASM_000836 /TAXON_ID=2866 /ORGANISM="Crypthecodinium cohnii, Strain Seligo" /LENGTH=657 /DNA_ID=CAMNT_0053912627 /DNA_START=220 /DNA_END=2193 /DNA_ORIENTATION=-